MTHPYRFDGSYEETSSKLREIANVMMKEGRAEPAQFTASAQFAQAAGAFAIAQELERLHDLLKLLLVNAQIGA